MTYARKQLPKYCLHKASGRASVRIDGKMYYLGKHGSQASRREYDRIIGEFIANGRQAFHDPDTVLIENLIVSFLDYVEKECSYCPSSLLRINRPLQLLNELYGKTTVAQFTPSALKALRRQYLERGLARDTINAYIWTIKRMFTWGIEEEIVPPDVGGAIKSVKDLQIGKTTAREYNDVAPVADDILEKTLPHIESKQFRDMARVQRLIGGRPQDVHNMRFCDIDRSAEIWRYAPFAHKTKKLGKTRLLPIGPKAQAILKNYLDREEPASEEFVFPRPRGKCQTRQYCEAIAKACAKAGVPPWRPNQLRHAAAKEVRDRFDLDHAQAVLGHANARMTEHYAEVSFEKAAKVAREIG